MFITATNDKASILSGIINCIGSSDAKVIMVIAPKRPIADILYITKEILYLLEDTQDCDYKILTNSTYFCVEFENGSVFEVKYYQPNARGKRADMMIIDEYIPEEDKRVLLNYCTAIDRSII
jgi:hypothetical protein